MTPGRSREIERLYHEACRRLPPERSAFLAGACAGDDSLRTEVESLLAWREQADGFLQTPATRTADGEPAGRATPPASSVAAARPGFLRRRPWWVWCCALSSIAAVAGMYFIVFTAPQQAGWRLRVLKTDGRATSYQVIGTRPGSAAERAGFEVDDLLSIADVERFARDPRPGASYRFGVVHGGLREVRTLTLAPKDWMYWRGSEGLGRLAVTLASAAHLALAVILLFARPRDRAARWGVLLFAQIAFYLTVASCGPRFAPESAHVVRSLALPVGVLVLLGWSLSAAMPAAAFGFSAVFPKPLPFSDRRWWPWWLVAVALVATTGINLESVWLPVYAGPGARSVPRLVLAEGIVLGMIFVSWAVALLARSYRRIDRPNERRRLRLVVAGFAVTAATLAVDMFLMAPWWRLERLRLSPYWQFPRILPLSAAALCLAYAILRHRVFDIHVIIRLGVRYAVARGALLSVLPAAGVTLALDVILHRDQPVTGIAADRGVVYLAVAAGALALHLKRRAWMDALDRRFFRERYDAHRLLGGVVEDVRRSASFDEAGRQVVAQDRRGSSPRVGVADGSRSRRFGLSLRRVDELLPVGCSCRCHARRSRARAGQAP